MAGGHHDVLRHDPAIEKWATMRENTLKHFKWTPRTSGLSLFWGIVVPVGIYELIIAENRRQDAIKGIPPQKYLSFFN